MPFRIHLGCLFIVLSILSAPALSQTRQIDGADELLTALAEGGPSQDLILAPGHYGAVALPQGRAPAVIRSADPTNPAILSGLTASNFIDLRLENLYLHYDFASGDDTRTRPFEFRNFERLVLVGNRIEGDVARGLGADDNGYPSGVGLWLQDCRDVTLRSNEILVFHRGLVAFRCQDVTIEANQIFSIRSDGMNFAEVQDVVVTGNHVHSFIRSESSPDHADMIQIWTNGTENATRNVTIAGNVLNSGSGLYTQSIFMRNDLVDRGLAGQEMFYRNITIEENVIINAHLHGITIGETDGLTIRHNTVVQNIRSAGADPGRTLWVPMIRVAELARDVRIEGNIASTIEGAQPDWLVQGNLLVQPQAYGQVFQGMMGGDPTQVETFRYSPDGPAAAPGIGAAYLRP